MSEKRCYYDVLGIQKECPKGDIRKAYKKLALKYHPDRNNGCTESEAKFKEVTEAYTILNDDGKRGRYDQFGHAGVDGAAGFSGNGDIFSHFQDIFSDFFGGFSGGRQRSRGPARGRDLRVAQQLTLEEAVLGCKKDIPLTTPVECGGCGGSGAKPGTQPTTCGTCGGAGQVSTGRGFIMFTQTCPTCQGEGATVSDPCSKCDGAGWEEKQRTVTVSFPPGIDHGHRLRVGAQGMPGPRGGQPGHLYVDIHLAPHERFERDGDDLITKRKVSFPEAALGTSFTVEMLDGSEHEVKLRPGTQPGAVVTSKGKGAPSVNGRGTGSLHVLVQVDVPKRLSRKAKKLLRELSNEIGEATAKTA